MIIGSEAHAVVAKIKKTKNYFCKHIKLQTVRSKFFEKPLQAKTITLHDMPKRGRPSIISKPLEFGNQPPFC